jgi:hypothetical protein
MRLRSTWLFVIAGAALLGCGGDDQPAPPSVERDIVLSTLDPGVLVPGSRIVLSGANFVPDFAGRTTLHLDGTVDGESAQITLDARFMDYDAMESDWPGAFDAGSRDGHFSGHAYLTASSALDGLEHESGQLALELELASELVPRLDSLQNQVTFVNDPIVAVGDGFLLGGDEGQTFAIVEGCFTEQGQTSCQPVGPAEVPAEPVTPYRRDQVQFPFAPAIAGIRPGSFDGTVTMLNRHGPAASHVEHGSAALPTANSIAPPAIVEFTPTVASLGQFVDVTGGGFVGTLPNDPDPTQAFTLIELVGTFTTEGQAPAPVTLSLLPEFKHGQLVRYVINEEDALGQALDVRKEVGTFVGTAQPITAFGPDSVSGSTLSVTLGVGHVKQIVWLRFLPTFVESLRHFGLRAADGLLRQRVLEVTARDYAGINIEFRTEKPADFALYSELEIGGPDPNGLGLFGYDNTPGKDDGNLRLFDKIGGVNALTQLDGYPGYGGVFVESLFSFSLHPQGLAESNGGEDQAFDQLFDPFRPDLGGAPILGDELAGLSPLQSGASCPAGDRNAQIACAIWALGSLIGTTVTHEIAHSLGLADPGGEAFHNMGDWPNAIMDAGGARSFRERAELLGEGPGSFCAVNYDYLRAVLPSSDPDPLPQRQDCY